MKYLYFLYTRNIQNQDAKIVTIKIESVDRPGLLYAILGVFAHREINVSDLKVYSLRPSRNAFYKIGLEIKHYDELSEVYDELLEIDGVKDLTRL